MPDAYYDSWLAPRLVNNNFPWNQATSTTFPELLRRVTFHDGYWHGWFPVLDDNSCLLVLQPDTVWNPEFCHQRESWPYLVIEIGRVLQMSRDVVPDAIMPGISNAESAPVNAARFTEWLEFAKVYDLLPADFFDYQKPQPPLYRTDIHLLVNGTLSMIHEAPIRLLLYSETGERLPVRLPDV
ncbi:hypothetical protein [Hymenobacter edaphi]|uniref:Uncharacterized protein n=1 Tax=Hymenobacter edaphi TaxID=2211146 RepID=A0A328BCL4_9BACT|nr:hypothetical protein [Hymenobacter edaphi]RAK63544.1 hypothetical protein DLM85_21320 [Hymenobacter edaphi]